MALHVLADAVPKVLQELDFLQIFLVLGFDASLALVVLLLEPLDESHEMLLYFVLFLGCLKVQSLQILLYHEPVLAEQLNFIVELG